MLVKNGVWFVNGMQVLVGIVASAFGAVAGVAYIGYKGNSHVGWNKNL